MIIVSIEWLSKEKAFFSNIYIKLMILPRQARDKHRENSKEKAFFLLQGVLRGGAPGGSIAAVCWCNARNVKYACEESKARRGKTREDKTKTHAPCR